MDILGARRMMGVEGAGGRPSPQQVSMKGSEEVGRARWLCFCLFGLVFVSFESALASFLQVCDNQMGFLLFYKLRQRVFVHFRWAVVKCLKSTGGAVSCTIAVFTAKATRYLTSESFLFENAIDCNRDSRLSNENWPVFLWRVVLGFCLTMTI